MSETKALTGVSIKNADEGLVQAVFATLNVVDADGDVTLPGAFKSGQQVKISAYGHSSWSSALPVGKGTIRVEGEEAILDGQFFMDTAGGRETFAALKELGDLQEWSYGFDVVESSRGEFDGQDVQFLKELDVFEVSPVLLGAGVGTRTLAMKAAESGDEKSAEWPALSDHTAGVLGDVAGLVERVESFGTRSAKEGRVLSTANRERLSGLSSALADAKDRIDVLLAETDPQKGRDLLMREVMRFEQLRAETIL